MNLMGPWFKKLTMYVWGMCRLEHPHWFAPSLAPEHGLDAASKRVGVGGVGSPAASPRQEPRAILAFHVALPGPSSS